MIFVEIGKAAAAGPDKEEIKMLRDRRGPFRLAMELGPPSPTDG